MTKDVTFQYIQPRQDEVRLNPKFKGLCLTIATQITRLEDGYHAVRWTVAFKNPKDKFSKEDARRVCNSNLEPFGNYGEFVIGRKFTRNEIITKILAVLFTDELQIPKSYVQFVRHALLLNLFNGGLV